MFTYKQALAYHVNNKNGWYMRLKYNSNISSYCHFNQLSTYSQQKSIKV